MASPDDEPLVSRRHVLQWAGAAAGVAATAAVAHGWPDHSSAADRSERVEVVVPPGPLPASRAPVVFLPHGGGPWPFVPMGLDAAEVDALAAYLGRLGKLAMPRPKALLVVSAHWEEPVPTVMTHPQPPLLFDYYGFPADSCRLTWPAPGAPAVAARVRELLKLAGHESAADARRGFDHGTFVPLKLAFPAADVPTVQLSLQQGLDPAVHLAIGRALQPLRDEGVWIVASGMSFHNMRGFGRPEAVAKSLAFDRWLRQVVTAAPAARTQGLTQWLAAPHARWVHPREEHLLPLMVAVGAAGEDLASAAFSGTFMGVHLSAFHFPAT